MLKMVMTSRLHCTREIASCTFMARHCQEIFIVTDSAMNPMIAGDPLSTEHL